MICSSLESEQTELQKLLHQVLARDDEFIKTCSTYVMKMLKQKEPPSANEILDHSYRTTMSVQPMSLQDRMICAFHVKIDFLNIRIAVHY